MLGFLVIAFFIMVREQNQLVSALIFLAVLLAASMTFSSTQKIDYDDFGKYRKKGESDGE